MSDSSNPSGEDPKSAALSTLGWMCVTGVLSLIAIVILAVLGPLGKV